MLLISSVKIILKVLSVSVNVILKKNMDSFAKITPGQKKLLEIIESLKPFERIEIIADSLGKPDVFLVIRSSKVVVKGMFITPVK